MKWLLLDDSSNQNHICMTIQQLAEQLSNTEEKVEIINTFHNSYSVPKKDVEEALHKLKPDVVLFQGPTGLRYFDILGPYSGICINVWFDDPLMRIAAYGLDKEMADSKCLFEHFIWDGYWRDVAKSKWGVNSSPIHLAANGKEFYESSTVFNPNDIIFLGNLHSPRSIELMMEGLPPTYVRLIKFCRNYLEQLPETCDVPSWDQLLKIAFGESLPGEQRLIMAQGERGNEKRANLQSCIWQISKNFVRVRMLKRAVKVGTVRMFADTVQHFHANESEIRGLVGEWSSRLAFHATDGFNADQLSELYHHGWIQIQATDPQSVEGGIPYRVFQTAASGRALLTDKKPELAEAFQYGTEILTYNDPEDFENALHEASKNKEELREIGRRARVRFEVDHTWEKRINFIKRKVGIGYLEKITGSQYYSNLVLPTPDVSPTEATPINI